MHCPVMLDEVLRLFSTQQPPLIFLDATFGRGGHSRALLSNFPGSTVTALDQDHEAIVYAKEQMDHEERFNINHQRFSSIKEMFPPNHFSGVLFDLGLSSPQVDQGDRGFSFLRQGPLDMRMDQNGPTASDLINTLSEKELADLFFEYGQEHASRRIASAIAKARAKSSIKTTQELSDIISIATPRRGKLHPATRVFQALRIAVNNEIEEIKITLPMAAAALKPGGCLIVIGFHSLEDAISKQFFKSSPCFDAISKKPIRPNYEEIKINPRARSARLRCGVKKQ